MKGNAAAAATTLTIRHSRFATLTLAKLVASLALHPPISATEADYAPHHRLRRSLSSRRSLLVSTLSNTYNLLLSPSSVSLFARHLLPFGRRLFCRRFLCHLDVLPNYRSQPCLILAPNNAPVAADSAAGREGVRSTTEGEIFKGTDGACADPDTRIFPATGQQCRLSA